MTTLDRSPDHMTDPALTAGPHREGGVWPSIRTERAALAADLADLTDEQWAMPSLCAGLSVREVLAHLTAGAGLNTVRWLAGVIRCRFDFDRRVAMRLAEQLGATPGRDPRTIPARRPEHDQASPAHRRHAGRDHRATTARSRPVPDLSSPNAPWPW
ncbi:maleylpyruvate isomerase N-terminal domain-containing protein [Streptomyces sp. NPDC006617]|uniref:maleylpyruvate isomerase N-terminal domain-containing protein n=1 Tax=Streptomyces sp. NPDC006617 TaxID=3155354 RepID=UPI0033BE0407